MLKQYNVRFDSIELKKLKKEAKAERMSFNRYVTELIYSHPSRTKKPKE